MSVETTPFESEKANFVQSWCEGVAGTVMRGHASLKPRLEKAACVLTHPNMELPQPRVLE